MIENSLHCRNQYQILEFLFPPHTSRGIVERVFKPIDSLVTGINTSFKAIYLISQSTHQVSDILKLGVNLFQFNGIGMAVQTEMEECKLLLQNRKEELLSLDFPKQLDHRLTNKLIVRGVHPTKSAITTLNHKSADITRDSESKISKSMLRLSDIQNLRQVKVQGWK